MHVFKLIIAHLWLTERAYRNPDFFIAHCVIAIILSQRIIRNIRIVRRYLIDSHNWLDYRRDQFLGHYNHFLELAFIIIRRVFIL